MKAYWLKVILYPWKPDNINEEIMGAKTRTSKAPVEMMIEKKNTLIQMALGWIP